MKRRYTYILLLLAAAFLGLASCQQEVFAPVPDIPDGYVKISFNTNANDFEEVSTRAVDSDGGGVNNMVLFCFDSYGVFITTTEATNLTPNNSNPSKLTGTFEATIPESTTFIHFVANQNHESIDQTKLYNKSEGAAMEQLEASSGRMIYWARKEFDTTPSGGVTMAEHLNSQLRQETIMLIRNHAKITVNRVVENTTLAIEGMAVVNSYAFGTVCPWHPELKFEFTWPGAKSSNGEALTPTEDFVTIPGNRTKLSEENNTTSDLSRYVYEHENTLEDPISVIISGRKTGETKPKYYRVLLLDENSDPIMIRRNHNYTINIEGDLNYGQDSFTSALEAPATNNVWISVADNIKEIRDNKYSLAVQETAKILGESYTISPGNTYRFTYTVEDLEGDNLTAADKPEITWVEGNTAGYDYIDDTKFEITGSKAEGSVGISLKPMAEGVDMQEGTILIKKGRLFRRVKIYTVKTMDFLPAWASAEVFGGTSSDNFTPANVTVMFTIPDDCPEEIFPFNVLLSCNKLDVRFIDGSVDENGNVLYEPFTLPIIREGEEGYGEPNSFGYKYVFEVTAPGVQRVYMRNSMYEEDGVATTVKIEAPFFNSVTKEVTFTEHTSTIIPVMEGIVGYASSGQPIGNETVYYKLVPQKKNAVVEFGMKLASSSSSSSVALGADDEFLLYSRNLVLLDGDETYGENYYKDNVTDGCEYIQVSPIIWEGSSNGRMMAFRPVNRAETANSNGYKLRLRTNKAKSDEIVRIASIPFWGHQHPAGYSPFTGKSVFKNFFPTNRFEGLTELTSSTLSSFANYVEKLDASPYCHGYRSATFELSNYNPFRFGAVVTFAPDQTEFNETTLTGLKRVFGDDDVPAATDHTSAEKETVMEWPYRPGSQVDIAIDVTSFGGSDNNSVDPFGMQFDIYIDAPMLSIDEGVRYPANWKVDKDGNGGVILNDKDGNIIKDKDGNPVKADKLRQEFDQSGTWTGRFIYTVDADERAYAAANTAGFSAARIVDTKHLQADKTETYTPGTQTYDRRTLPFVVSGVVSQGEIKISSDQEMAVFYDKTFKVNNVARNMKLTYGEAGQAGTLVPEDAFVSFELKRNHNRIGIVTMKDAPENDRNCTLRLRAEYEYNWYGDDVIIRYQDSNGNVYTNEAQVNQMNAQIPAQYFDLAYLFKNSVVHLTPVPASGN